LTNARFNVIIAPRRMRWITIVIML
jgi:hypothetical protein